MIAFVPHSIFLIFFQTFSSFFFPCRFKAGFNYSGKTNYIQTFTASDLSNSVQKNRWYVRKRHWKLVSSMLMCSCGCKQTRLGTGKKKKKKHSAIWLCSHNIDIIFITWINNDVVVSKHTCNIVSAGFYYVSIILPSIHMHGCVS